MTMPLPRMSSADRLSPPLAESPSMSTVDVEFDWMSPRKLELLIQEIKEGHGPWQKDDPNWTSTAALVLNDADAGKTLCEAVTDELSADMTPITSVNGHFLYLGDTSAMESRLNVVFHRIRGIVYVSYSQYEHLWADDGVQYKGVMLSMSEDITVRAFKEVLEFTQQVDGMFLETLLSSWDGTCTGKDTASLTSCGPLMDGPILVCCNQADSSSAALVCALLMQTGLALSVNEAIDMVTYERSSVSLTPALTKQLDLLADGLFGEEEQATPTAKKQKVSPEIKTDKAYKDFKLDTNEDSKGEDTVVVHARRKISLTY